MQLQLHTKLQFKILKRYLNLLLVGLIVFLTSTIFAAGLYEYRFILNIPLMIAIINGLIIGPLLGDIFCGEETEKRNYSLAPWAIRPVILSKNIILVLVFLITPIPMLFGSFAFIKGDPSGYLNACLYLITAVPVFIITGGMISVMKKRKGIQNSSPHAFFQFLMFVASLIPYLVFQVWLQSVVLCFAFCVLSLAGWYIYVLPYVINKFRMQNYNLQKI